MFLVQFSIKYNKKKSGHSTHTVLRKSIVSMRARSAYPCTNELCSASLWCKCWRTKKRMTVCLIRVSRVISISDVHSAPRMYDIVSYIFLWVTSWVTCGSPMFLWVRAKRIEIRAIPRQISLEFTRLFKKNKWHEYMAFILDIKKRGTCFFIYLKIVYLCSFVYIKFWNLRVLCKIWLIDTLNVLNIKITGLFRLIFWYVYFIHL